MKIIGVIPARYASTRFPGKPLADICGKPMIWWVYKQAKKVVELDEVYVATDDEKIEKVCQSYEIKVLMTSTEHKTPNDRVYEVSRKIDGDIFVCINGDEPLIEPEAIKVVLPRVDDKPDLEYFYSNAVTSIESPVELIDPSNIKAVANAMGDAMWATRSPIPYPKASLSYPFKKLVGIAAFSKKSLEFYVTMPRSDLEKVEELDLYRFLENNKKVKLREVNCKTLSVDTPQDLEQILKIVTGKIDGM